MDSQTSWNVCFSHKLSPAGTWCRNDVIVTWIRRHYVALTSFRHCYNVIYLLGQHIFAACGSYCFPYYSLSLKKHVPMFSLNQSFLPIRTYWGPITQHGLNFLQTAKTKSNSLVGTFYLCLQISMGPYMVCIKSESCDQIVHMCCPI